VPFTSIILLAAGESTRMGRPKQTLPWFGVPLLRWQVEQAGRSGADELIVVLGERVDEYCALLPEKLDRVPVLRIVENADFAAGKTTSVKAGVRAVDERSTTVVPWAVDSPRTAELLDTLIEGHLAGGLPISYPWHDGHEGHPPLFELTLRDELLDISEEHAGLREVRHRNPARVHRIDVDNPLVLVNMNTPEQYRRALELTGQAPGDKGAP
jgi:molybdenum cofactor cytidylyltransferase